MADNTRLISATTTPKEYAQGLKTMNKPVCSLCGGPVVHGNLYCCAEHDAALEDQRRTREIELKEAGFVQDAEALNVYRRDGVSITLEHIAYVGLEKVLSHHETVTAIRAHALGVRASEPEAASAEPATHGASVGGSGDLASAGEATG